MDPYEEEEMWEQQRQEDSMFHWLADGSMEDHDENQDLIEADMEYEY